MRLTRLTKQLTVPVTVNLLNSVYNPETLSSELNMLMTGDLIIPKSFILSYKG
jgi:hypothetical protein